MKRIILVALVVLLSIGQLFAKHVDVATAKSVGAKFVRNNMESLRGFHDSKHILTISDDNGNACLYIFNIEDKGFYIVSADDRARPILAYSDEGAIDVNNIPSSMNYYLNYYKDAISFAIENDLMATQYVKEEWSEVMSRGVVSEVRLGKSVEPLVDLLWDQVYPYNSLCPTELGGPEGHACVGCAADVMAMVMKYWNYPETGVGSKSYVPEGYPAQSVDFASTTYDWASMPKQLFWSSKKQEIEAVSLLMYHCGVSIEMQYGPTASSGYSEMVPAAMKNHFRFTGEMKHRYRDDYTKEEWENMLIENFDQGFPVFYAGSSPVSGGHAFICDGYTEDRYFHFNWGWSGLANGNFLLDALTPANADYSENQRAIFDMIPDYAYDVMPQAPSIEIHQKSAYSLKAMVELVAPVSSVAGKQLETIDKIVVLRNNQEVYTENNVTPGSTVTFEDEVDEYGVHSYSVYAVSGGIKGRRAEVSSLYGSTCKWQIITTTNSYQGWNGASLQVMSGQDVFYTITMTSSKPQNVPVQMPEGEVSFVWTEPSMPMSSLSIKIKNSSDVVVYEYSGSSSALNAGLLYTGTNDCMNCKAPENLSAEFVVKDGKEGALISWDRVDAPQSYKVYRSSDNENYEEIAIIPSSEDQYFDANENSGIYYYKVTAYNEYCESMPAVTADEDCDYVVVELMALDENVVCAKIYPNPASDIIRVAADGITNVSIYNIMGQKLINQDLNNDACDIDVSDLGNGVYMLKVSTLKGVSAQKITLVK